MEILKTLGKKCFIEDVAIFDGLLSQSTMDSLTSQLLRQCKDAYDTFGKELPDWVNEDSLKKMWLRHNGILDVSSGSYCIMQSCEEEIHLYAALLICTVRRESWNAYCVAEKTYTMLSDFIKQRKGGS